MAYQPGKGNNHYDFEEHHESELKVGISVKSSRRLRNLV